MLCGKPDLKPSEADWRFPIDSSLLWIRGSEATFWHRAEVVQSLQKQGHDSASALTHLDCALFTTGADGKAPIAMPAGPGWALEALRQPLPASAHRPLELISLHNWPFPGHTFSAPVFNHFSPRLSVASTAACVTH